MNDPAAQLIVIRGARSSGKSMLIAYWLEHRPETSELVVPIALQDRDGATPDYWSQIAAQLGAAVHAPVGPGGELPELVAQLNATEQPILLVIEDFSSRADQVLADQLCALLSRCSTVRAVVETRTRVFAKWRLMSVPHVELGPEDLSYAPDEIVGVHQALGFGIAMEAAERIYRAVGGDVVAVLLAAQIGKRLQTPVVDKFGVLARDYNEQLIAMAESVLAMPAIVQWRGLILNSAPFRTLEPGFGVALGVLGAGLTSRLETLGIVQRRSADDGLEYPSGLRIGLLGIARRDLPGVTDGLFAELVERSLYLGRPADAVRYAADADQWQTVGQVICDHYPALLDSDIDGLLSVLQAFPEHIRAAFPLVAGLRALMTGLGEFPMIPIELPESVDELIAIGKSESAMNVATIAAVRAVAQSRLGYLADAVELSDRILVILGQVFEIPGASSDVHRSALRMMLGGIYLSASRFSDATMQLQSAYRSGNNAVRRVSAGMLALNWAIQGSIDTAEEWLELHSAEGDRWGSLEPSVRMAADCARALCALERFDLEASEKFVEEMGEIPFQEVKWAYFAYVRCLHLLLSGEAEIALDWLDNRIQQHRHYYFPGALSHAVLNAVRVSLLLAVGRGNAAASEAAEHRDSPSAALLVARARVELRTARLTAALTTISGAVSAEGVLPRVRLDALLVEAEARWSLGEADIAVARWRAAVKISEATHCVVPFAFVDPAARAALAQHSRVPVPSLVPPELRLFPADVVNLVRLTPREGELLELMAKGRTLREISIELFISVNTAKTQRRSLYKKLNGSTKDEVLATARRLNLVSDSVVLAESG